jgi:hypothetical protein
LSSRRPCLPSGLTAGWCLPHRKKSGYENAGIEEVSMIEILVGLFIMFLLGPEKSQKNREEIIPMIFNDESANSDSDVNEDADDHIDF